jgi:hypothetical protein
MSDEKVVEGKEVRVVGKIEIFVLSDGNVTVSGPLKNTAAIIDIFGKALGALANFINKEASPIVTPMSGLKV